MQMTFVNLWTQPNTPPGAPPTHVIYRYYRALVYIPVEVPEEQRVGEAFNLLGLNQQDEQDRLSKLATVREQFLQIEQDDAGILDGIGQGLNPAKTRAVVRYHTLEARDLRRGMELEDVLPDDPQVIALKRQYQEQ